MSNSTTIDHSLDAWRREQNASYTVIDEAFDIAKQNIDTAPKQAKSTSTDVFYYAFSKEVKAMEEAIMDAAGDTVAGTAKATQTTRKLAVLMGDCIKHATEFDLSESELFAAEWSSHVETSTTKAVESAPEPAKEEEFTFTFNSMIQ